MPVFAGAFATSPITYFSVDNSETAYPRVRLSTVLTNFPFEPATPIEKNYCGKCTECIDSCPAKAIIGGKWYPGLPREQLVNVYKCDDWKKKNYFAICEGSVCGICMAICPFGRKSKK